MFGYPSLYSVLMQHSSYMIEPSHGNTRKVAVSKVVAKILRFSLLCILVLCFFLGHNLNCAKDAYAYDSRQEWQDGTTFSGGIINGLKTILGMLSQCFLTQTLFAAVNPDNNCLPNRIGKDVKDTYCDDRVPYNYLLNQIFDVDSIVGMIVAVIVIAVAVAILTSGAAAPILAPIIGYQLGLMIDLCVNTYVYAPHEYINDTQGRKADCPGSDAGCNPALTKDDVPYFFQCGNKDEYGYMGEAYCATKEAKNVAEASKDKIGSLTVKRVNLWGRLFFGNNDAVNEGVSFSRKEIKTGDGKWLGGGTLTIPALVRPYYRYHGGNVQLCAAVSSALIPFSLGCTYVPPPTEEIHYADTLKELATNTRCGYFLKGSRTDLRALGSELYNSATGEHSSASLFLLSDMHLTSTVVGCIQDLLTVAFINPANNSTSFFATVQSNMKAIVVAVLTLYITLLGIRIMSSPQAPQMSEWVMYLLKFALVFYFALGNVWYSDANVSDGGASKGQLGIYPAILSGMETLASILMQGSNDADPLRMCYHPINKGENLLLSGRYPGPVRGEYTNSVYNPGKRNIMLTVWDYIDCKVINYLNFNSCKYEASTLTGFWFIVAGVCTALFKWQITALLIGIMAAIQCFVLLLIVFRLVHIVILSMFTVTILVLVAPIILCFALFDYTKKFYETWLSMLVGYSIYPALFFAFITLMFATFDTVMYGNPAEINKIIREQCAGNIDNCKILPTTLCNKEELADSPYCKFLKKVNSGGSSIGNCSITKGKIMSALTEEYSVPVLGTFTVLKNDIIPDFYDTFLKLGIIALLFGLFVELAIGMIDGIMQVAGLGNFAKGSIRLDKAFMAEAKVNIKMLQLKAKAAKYAAGKVGGVMSNALKAVRR
ncbi:type IV secretion system protein VirB6 [Alphaproteobacteria bacterium]